MRQTVHVAWNSELLWGFFFNLTHHKINDGSNDSNHSFLFWKKIDVRLTLIAAITVADFPTFLFTAESGKIQRILRKNTKKVQFAVHKINIYGNIFNIKKPGGLFPKKY